MSYVRKNQNLAIYPLENATAEFNLVLAEDGQTVSGSLEYGMLTQIGRASCRERV